MTVRRRTVLGTALAGIAPAFLPSLGRAAGVSDNEIVLGTHLDFSGASAIVGPPMRNGLQMKVDEINEAGGINGRKIKFVIEDNGAQASLAVRAVDKLLRKDEIFAMLCPFGSGANVATVKKVLDANVVCFGPFGASALIRKAAGTSPLLFTTNLNYDTTAAAAVWWAMSNLGSKKIGYIYQEGPYGDLVQRGLTAILAAKGTSIQASASYKIGDIDFSSQVARMKAAGVDLIVAAAATRETIGICTEVKKLGWKGVNIMTASSGRIDSTASVGKDAVEGLYGVGCWRIIAPSEMSAETKRWADSYKKRFNVVPDDLALLFYDYASWFFQAVQATGRDLTTEKLVKALQASSYKGASSYDTQRFKDNHIDPEWTQVEQVVGGHWVAKSKPIDPTKSS